jgi:hypothetical protein
MTGQEKLAIANAGGMFQETDEHSWVGHKIRKGKKTGKVIEDWNGGTRNLVVLFDDGSKETIILNNIGANSEQVHQYAWHNKHLGWVKF